jgi:branched-chain amino acid transport system substrate-binding protein
MFFAKSTTPILTLFFLLFFTSSTSLANSNKTLALYHDADWSHHFESSESIWRGIETALSEIDHEIQGYKIKIVKADHKGNVIRSRKNMADFLNDPTALALVSGLHSPPLIKYRKYINENKLLTLVPWAAGGPITRYPSSDNWVFRVSLDDTKVGKILVAYALNEKKCLRPHLLLESTPWGDSNLSSITKALKQSGHKVVRSTRFDWNMKSYVAKDKISLIIEQGSDCIILVSNTIEGAEIAKAVNELQGQKKLTIISHWGITGGDFHTRINSALRKNLDLSFVQSCFSFLQEPLSKKAQTVFANAKNLFPDSIKYTSDIRSPVGFIHGYDATLLLIEALKNTSLSDNMIANRAAIKVALENMQQPVKGLLKTYEKPFSVFSTENIDAHEALNYSDYCMAKYTEDDNIVLI